MEKNKHEESVDLVLKLAELAYTQIVNPVQKPNQRGLLLGYKPRGKYNAEPWTKSKKAIEEVKRMAEEEPERFLEV